MSDNQEWSKVETQQPMVDWAVTPSVSGVLTEVKSDIGPNLSKVYVLQNEAGEETGVWGATLLDAKMAKVAIGTVVKIDYIGMSKTKDGKRTFKDFDVFQKPAPFVKVEAEKAVEDVEF